MLAQWFITNAIPCRDEVISVWKGPSANVLMMKLDIGVPARCHFDHLTGDIQAFYFKTMANQQISNSAAATATDIDCVAPVFDKCNSALVLMNAVVARKLPTIP